MKPELPMDNYKLLKIWMIVWWTMFDVNYAFSIYLWHSLLRQYQMCIELVRENISITTLTTWLAFFATCMFLTQLSSPWIHCSGTFTKPRIHHTSQKKCPLMEAENYCKLNPGNYKNKTKKTGEITLQTWLRWLYLDLVSVKIMQSTPIPLAQSTPRLEKPH